MPTNVKGWDDAPNVKGWDDGPTKGWDDTPTKEGDNLLTQYSKGVTKLVSEGAGAVGSLVPMAATYLQYANMRRFGAGHEDAVKEADALRERLDPSMGLDQLADTMGVDKDWIHSSHFRDFMEGMNEYWFKPSADKYTPEPGLARTAWNDLANLVTFGVAGKAGGALNPFKGTGIDKAAEQAKRSAELRAAQAAAERQANPDFTGPTGPGGSGPVTPQHPDFVGPQDNGFMGPPENVVPGHPDFMGPVDNGFMGPTQDYGLPLKKLKLPPSQEWFPAITEKGARDTMPPQEADLGFPPVETPDGLPDAQARAMQAIDDNQPLQQIRLDETDKAKTNSTSRPNPAFDANLEFSDGQAPKLYKKYQDAATKGWDDPAAPGPRPEPLPAVEANEGLGPQDRNSIRGNPEAADALSHARTIGDAVRVALQYGSKEEQGIAHVIMKAGVDHDVPFELDRTLENNRRGQVWTSKDTGDRVVSVDPRGGDAATILHEATHVHTNDALTAADAGRATPAQARYANELGTLYNHVKTYLTDHPEVRVLPDWLKNLKEFNAYGLTEPLFQQILHSIPLTRGETVLSNVFGAIKRFFGVKEKDGGVDSAFTRMLDLTDQWKNIVDKSAEVRAENRRIVAERMVQDAMRERALSEGSIFSDGKGLRGTGPGRNQSGYIDLKGMWDVLKGVFGFSDKIADNLKKKLDTHSQQFDNPKDLRIWLSLNMDKVKDLWGTKNAEYAGMWNTINQLATRIVDNPVVAFTLHYMQESARQAEKRMYGYHLRILDSKRWATRNTKDAVDFFRQWIQLNAKPELRPLAEQLSQDPAALKKYFVDNGVSPEAFDRLKPYMDVLKDVAGADGNSLATMGRKLIQQALYFPLGRHGPYHITVWDESGDVRWAYAHDSLADARHNMDDIRKAMPSGWKTSDVVHTDPTHIINSSMMEAMLNNAPEWLHDIAVGTMSKQMEFVRNFEKGRSRNYEVKGYVGELKPETNAEYSKQLKDILDVLSQRFRESYHLEQASAAIRIGNELLSDNSVLGDHLPNTHRLVNNMVMRQIGMDLGGAKQGGMAQDLLKGIGHVVTRVDGILNGYKPEFDTKVVQGPDGKTTVSGPDNVVPDTAFKALVKTLNYTASLMKIGLNPNVLAGNLIQNAFIMLDGVRAAGRIGVNPLVAVKTQIEHLAYLATLGQLDRHAEVKEFMKNAKAEGIIDPHGREDFSITDARERTRNLGPVDSIVQGPRDAIERLTNYNTVLYYKLFMDNVKQMQGEKFDMNDLDFKQTIYSLTHSFTGDYSPQANLMGFEKMGAKGAILSNFAKWKFNRTGRYLDDATMVLNAHKYGPTAIVPLMGTIALGLAMSGVQGTIGIVEYEAVRQWMNKLFGVKMKPMAAIISDYAPSMKDSWLNRGGVTALSDMVAQHFGEKSGPDFSGSMRDSSVLEVSTILPGTLVDAGKAAYIQGVKKPLSDPNIQKKLNGMFNTGMAGDIWKFMKDQHFTGVTHENTEETIAALPTVAQEPFRQAFFNVEQKRGNDTITEQKQKLAGNYKRDPFQSDLAYFGGVKTTDERRHDDATGYYRYMDHMLQNNKQALRGAMVQAMMDQNQQMMNYTFQRMTENHPDSAQTEINGAVQDFVLKSRLEFFEGKENKAAKMHGAAQLQALQMVQKAEQVWKTITPKPTEAKGWDQ